MGFTTQIFLFIFFPFSIVVYFLCVFAEKKGWLGGCFARLRLKEWILVAICFAFYGAARISGIKELFLYIVAVYLAARLIEWCRLKKLIIPIFQEHGDDYRCLWKTAFATIALVGAAALVVCLLIRCKYWGFFSGNPVAKPYAFLGISFLTFSALSYLVDVYKEKAKVGSFLDCALYLSFFPKVVSGPIVL